MKPIVTLLVAAGLVAVAPGVEAKKSQMQDIDFGSYTCEQFVQETATASADDMGGVLLWLDGYLSGISGDTVLSWSGLQTFTEALINYCSRNSDTMMLDAAEKVGVE